MIVWAVAGLFVGWVSSTRLRVDGLGVFLLSTVVLPLAIFAVVRHFDGEVMLGYAVFWVAVQGSYLFGNVIAERRGPRRRDTDERGSLEGAGGG